MFLQNLLEDVNIIKQPFGRDTWCCITCRQVNPGTVGIRHNTFVKLGLTRKVCNCVQCAFYCSVDQHQKYIYIKIVLI